MPAHCNGVVLKSIDLRLPVADSGDQRRQSPEREDGRRGGNDPRFDIELRCLGEAPANENGMGLTRARLLALAFTISVVANLT